MLTDRQLAQLLTQIAVDVRAIRKLLEPEPDRQPTTRKKDPRALYGNS